MKSHEEILKRYIKNQKLLRTEASIAVSIDDHLRASNENELIEWILEED